ncbi:MAG: MFS transporter [Streptosporangiaceae bacterium]
MTHVPAGLGADKVGPPEPAGGRRRIGGGYLELLRTPGAAQFCLAGMVGRAPMAMFGLGTVLLIAASTGRYGLAGTIAAAGSVGYAACAPQLARLADRFGQHRVLRPLVAIFGVSCLALVTCAELHAPIWVLLITSGLAGAAMPSLGSMVRARWSALLGNSPALHSAFALESVVDEMIFVVGPAVVTLLATSFPPAGVLVCMILSVAGTLLFAAQRRTEPAVRPPLGPRRPPLLRRDGHRSDRPTGRGRLPAVGLATMAPVYLCLGAMFASIDLSTVDFAQRHGHKPLAGFILGTYALGSAIGGLWYGSREWRAPLARRFPLTLALTVAGVATFWAEPGLLSLDVSVLVAGLTISPTLIAGYGLIERQAPPERRTEAMTWLSSAISVGVAVGSAATGRIVDNLGPRWGYAVAAAFGLIAVTVCLLGRGRLYATAETQAAQWLNA